MKTAFAFFLLVAVIALSCTHKTPRAGAGLDVARTDSGAPSKADDGEGDEGDDDDLL